MPYRYFGLGPGGPPGIPHYAALRAPGRAGRDKSFSGIVRLPAGSPGAVWADAPIAPNPNNPVKISGNTAFISHLRCKLTAINAEDLCFVP